ncbi:MAG: peptidase S8 and S53 subtilisin kexin sedolisin [Terrestrivirus sp.]|uniref:Peptidase S8 and S53 subtilisin kexin sedolisin n=1 Tax=Terrestrivirus sp. TaxID=2487775 RepID=A0A3G4ZQN5_9VIRU|nr:MAG: peptidase S8 and S53 subtilisin kexin sedolisin [Terrestrivirus sp.]
MSKKSRNGQTNQSNAKGIPYFNDTDLNGPNDIDASITDLLVILANKEKEEEHKKECKDKDHEQKEQKEKEKRKYKEDKSKVKEEKSRVREEKIDRLLFELEKILDHTKNNDDTQNDNINQNTDDDNKQNNNNDNNDDNQNNDDDQNNDDNQHNNDDDKKNDDRKNDDVVDTTVNETDDVMCFPTYRYIGTPNKSINNDGTVVYDPAGISPVTIKSLYGISQISGAPTGTGLIIGIVDAYTYANAASDLAVFSKQYSLPTPNLVVKTLGTTANTGWSLEQSLDIQWAHAIAPGATILLVQAASANMTDLLTAVKTAITAGANVISLSWGAGEASTQLSYDSNFISAVSNVVFVASAGDSPGVGYPSSSPNVLSVGGTTLTENTSTHPPTFTRNPETAWYNSSTSATGGGVSTIESIPSFQKNNLSSVIPSSGVVGLTTLNNKRGTPDVSFNADPNSGVSVYNTMYGPSTSSPWYTVGGTSFGAPAWAAIITLANQLRVAHKKTLLTNAVLQQGLYNLVNAKPNQSVYTYAQCFYDVTTVTGSPANGVGTAKLKSGTGYDLLTGLGTPNCQYLVPYLASL